MSVLVLRGDAKLLPLPDESADLVVTSPPYFGQRDYRDRGESLAGQIGNEETPQEYLANLAACTREWVRVLKPTGSLFVNIADKFSQRTQVRRSSHQPGIFPGKFDEFAESWAERSAKGATRMPHKNIIDGTGRWVPEKSLLALPWRYAIGCMDDLGLILRRDIIWRKLSALPESVNDRCATRHEYLFHMVKQPHYYAVVDEVREPADMNAHAQGRRDRTDRRLAEVNGGQTSAFNPLGKLPGSVWDIASQPLVVPEWLGLSHSAAFPMDLPRRCVLGWSPPAICLECGEGRWPVSSDSAAALNPRLASRTVARAVMSGGTSRSTLGRRASDAQRGITGYACACTPYTSHPASGPRAQRLARNRGPEGYHEHTTYGRKQAGEYERTGPWREYHLASWTPPPHAAGRGPGPVRRDRHDCDGG